MPTPIRAPMVGRDVTENHRAATPLELFFDLTFVVAVAQAGSALHHGVFEGDVGAVVSFVLTFFAIWWAWMNFTWFASAYDTDDGLYRAMVFVQMTGVLVLAAGGARVGRSRGENELASRPHGRAVWIVHHHRAG